jgi:regulator of sirC expression with transglutaminase-like and TPR domain
MSLEIFTNSVYEYVQTTYSEVMLNVIKSEHNVTVVSNVLRSAYSQSDSVEHAANKIIAMLKLNPSNP